MTKEKYMQEPKKYLPNPKASRQNFIKACFSDREDCYYRRFNLYGNYVKMTLKFDKDAPHWYSESVVDDGGELYFPFYNKETWKNNLVCQEVIRNYNLTMDDLVKKNILLHNESNFDSTKLPVKIRYASNKISKLEFIDEKSDWIDLRAAEDVSMKAGEFRLISLGVAMQLPDGYEAHIVPRSSTFKNFGVIQTNHMGVIDNSYCGNNDIWKFPAYAIRDTEIKINDRICQFRLVKKQPDVTFEEVKSLDGIDRGGFGSTGKN